MDGIRLDEWIEDTPPRCPRCGYDLRGSPSLVCPECGLKASVGELSREAKRARREAMPFQDVNWRVRCGLAVGLGAALVCLATRWAGMTGVMLVVGAIGGLVTTGCGAQAFRARGLSEHARQFLRQEPELVLAGVVTVLGLLLMVGSIWLA